MNIHIFKYKRGLIIIFKVAVSAYLLFYFINKIKADQLLYSLNHARAIFILIPLLLLFFNLFLQYKKWQITCSNILQVNNRSKIYHSLFAGFATGSITPARIGEYMGRALKIRDKSALQITTATFLDKLYPLVIVSLIGSICGLIFFNFYYNISFIYTVIISLILLMIFTFIFYLLFYPQSIINYAHKLFPAITKYNFLFNSKNLLARINKPYSARMLIISFLFYCCYIIQFAVLVSAFSEHSDIFQFIWAGILVMFTKSIIPSISLGDLGIREGASIYILGIMGETSTVAFNAAIMTFLINILIPSVTGIYFLLKKEHD